MKKYRKMVKVHSEEERRGRRKGEGRMEVNMEEVEELPLPRIYCWLESPHGDFLGQLIPELYCWGKRPQGGGL